jgi:hypothetical protein
MRTALLSVLFGLIAACETSEQPGVPSAGSAPNPFAARFASYAQDLDAFAKAHNLLIDRYYHDSSEWSFCFAHPRGGQARLDLGIDELGKVTLETVWWVDSYTEFTRSLKYGPKVELPENNADIVRALRSALSDVVDWRTGEWTEIATGNQSSWGQFTEQQFRSMTPQWPDPVL